MSIETEITRLVGAKQELASWLVSQGVTIPNGALLGDLVALLANLTAGGSSTGSAAVTVTLNTNVTLSSVYQFSNGIVTADSTSAGSYTCPVGSLLVLAVTVSGGTIRLNATPVITTTGALVSSTAYVSSSSSSLVKGVGVFLVVVKGDGSVTITRKTGTGTIA